MITLPMKMMMILQRVMRERSDYIQESLIKYLHRHTGENDPQEVGNVARGQEVRSDQYPVTDCFDWILACARMTTQKILGLNQSFLKIYKQPASMQTSVIGQMMSVRKRWRAEDFDFTNHAMLFVIFLVTI